MKIEIFLLKAYKNLSLDWKKQDVQLPQIKIIPRANNRTNNTNQRTNSFSIMLEAINYNKLGLSFDATINLPDIF